MSRNVMIVEDDDVLQEVYRTILSSQGYAVHVAGNGAVGVQMMKAVRPDLVLLDMFMPVMGGKEFLANLDLADYPGAKIVVFSNLSDKNTEAEMLGLGAHEIVLKSSLRPQDLIDLVERLVGPVIR